MSNGWMFVRLFVGNRGNSGWPVNLTGTSVLKTCIRIAYCLYWTDSYLFPKSVIVHKSTYILMVVSMETLSTLHPNGGLHGNVLNSTS